MTVIDTLVRDFAGSFDRASLEQELRLDDPAGQPLAVVRRIRDDIARRVEDLVAGLST